MNACTTSLNVTTMCVLMPGLSVMAQITVGTVQMRDAVEVSSSLVATLFTLPK